MIKNKIHTLLYNYFINNLGMRDYTRGWLKGDCPYCGAEDKFGINIHTNKAHCFRCDERDTPIEVVKLVENLGDLREVNNFLGDIDVKLDYQVIPKKVYKEAKKDANQISLPEDFSLLNMGNSRFAKSARKYMASRGFDINKLSLEGFGYCSSGKYMGYIIMPYYMGDKLVYFNARRYMLDGPKYNNPNEEEFGIGKSKLIYNMEALYIYNRVYLAEGLINAKTIGDKGISIGGKAISPWQLSTIIKSPVQEVTILLDPDAIVHAGKLALELSNHKRVKLVKIPENQDINSMGFIRSMKVICRTPWINNYNEALKINNQIKYEGTINSYH